MQAARGCPAEKASFDVSTLAENRVPTSGRCCQKWEYGKATARSYLVLPPSTFSDSDAAACAAANRAVSTRNGEQET